MAGLGKKIDGRVDRRIEETLPGLIKSSLEKITADTTSRTQGQVETIDDVTASVRLRNGRLATAFIGTKSVAVGDVVTIVGERIV